MYLENFSGSSKESIAAKHDIAGQVSASLQSLSKSDRHYIRSLTGMYEERARTNSEILNDSRASRILRQLRGA
jgi:DNA topoisomerase VI subunit B